MIHCLSAVKPENIASYQQQAKATRITAVVLALFAILLMGSGYLSMGIGTHPATLHLGMGIFPAVVGSMLVIFSGTMMFAAIVTAGVAASRYSALRHSSPPAS